MLYLLVFISQFFPFIIDSKNSSYENLADASFLNKVADRRVVIKEGHFHYENGERVRFYGTNVCFADAFPLKSEAEGIAKRMSQLGMNILRFHHMDNRDIWNANKSALSPESIDKLNYFLYQLKKYGIYANINLHVSREYPGLGELKTTFKYGKGLDRFYEPYIKYQEEYARDLLTTMNNYTGYMLGQDPMVAFVELNNENTIELVNQYRDLINNSVFENDLIAKWRVYLKKKYSSITDLTNKWNPFPINITNILHNLKPTFQFEYGKDYNISIVDSPQKHYNISIGEEGSYSWAYQFYYLSLPLEENTPYTFEFSAKSSIGESIGCSFQEQVNPWTVVSSTRFDINTTWETHRVALSYGKNPPGPVRFGCSIANTPHIIQMTNFSLYKGVDVKSVPATSLDTIGLPNSSFPTLSQADFRLLLIQTENDTHVRLQKYVKENLSVISLITDTQASYAGNFGALRASTISDFVDMHSYWQHPAFEPGFEWNSNHFTIKNTPMVKSPLSSTLRGLAQYKVENKPYTISEYDHPFPSEYNQEMFPMLSSYASFQDWDAIYQFSYDQKKYNNSHNGYFSMAINPTKIAFSQVAAILFRNFYVKASPYTVTNVIPISQLYEINKLQTVYYTPTGYKSSCNFNARLQRRYIESGNTTIQELSHPSINNTDQYPITMGEIEWKGDEGSNVFIVNTEKAKMATGFIGNNQYKIGSFIFEMELDINQTASIAIVSFDENSIENAQKMLLCVGGIVANTNQTWNSNRTSINYGWGTAPILTQFISFTAVIPGSGKLTVTPLSPNGVSLGKIDLKTPNSFSSTMNTPALQYIITREVENQQNSIMNYVLIGGGSICVVAIALGVYKFFFASQATEEVFKKSTLV